METVQGPETVQTNVRVAEADKPLILQVAQRLRGDPDFRDRLAALLEDVACAGMQERLKKLEQEVSWLLSGAIVVPRAPARLAQAAPAPSAPKLPPKPAPIFAPRRQG
ncbi:MAG TPA: hypothetical protein VE397_19275 [Stellaceae bacterium]|nr:hypothetical protein [Stellaceae bacterium]